MHPPPKRRPSALSIAQPTHSEPDAAMQVQEPQVEPLPTPTPAEVENRLLSELSGGWTAAWCLLG